MQSLLFLNQKPKIDNKCGCRIVLNNSKARISLIDNLLSSEPVTAYIGFDCTATSLHVGSLMQIMVLRWLKKLGHKPIILLGGATTKIGDPSGKDESRPILSDEDIAKNTAGIEGVFKQFGLEAVTMVNNDDWISEFSLVGFLRNIGRHFSVNRMLAFDSVKNRLDREEEMNFVEFTYMMMQALDFVELNKKYGCRLQIGGSDQWGNIVNGLELNRRIKAKENNIVLDEDFSGDQKSPNLIRVLGRLKKQHKNEQTLIDVEAQNDNKIFGLTTPLITTSSGAKMGKTADGAVWLSADKFSPYDYWQFWRNTDDKDVGKFLLLFTELEIPEIGNLLNLGNIATRDELVEA
ncbi:MAG: tyrosine--tRNA ligase, partial [Gammaproteobacteria bacterium]|nr:tyrosine--tRNA ligase [Gammaproteobacteria bacterium]